MERAAPGLLRGDRGDDLVLDLDFDNVLVTHGPPVIGRGRERLRRGLDAPPWSMRSG